MVSSTRTSFPMFCLHFVSVTECPLFRYIVALDYIVFTVIIYLLIEVHDRGYRQLVILWSLFIGVLLGLGEAGMWKVLWSMPLLHCILYPILKLHQLLLVCSWRHIWQICVALSIGVISRVNWHKGSTCWLGVNSHQVAIQANFRPHTLIWHNQLDTKHDCWHVEV